MSEPHKQHKKKPKVENEIKHPTHKQQQKEITTNPKTKAPQTTSNIDTDEGTGPRKLSNHTTKDIPPTKITKPTNIKTTNAQSTTSTSPTNKKASKSNKLPPVISVPNPGEKGTQSEAGGSTEDNKFDIDALFAKKKAASLPEQKTNKKQKTDHKQPKQVPQTRKPFGEDLPISMFFTSTFRSSSSFRPPFFSLNFDDDCSKQFTPQRITLFSFTCQFLHYLASHANFYFYAIKSI